MFRSMLATMNPSREEPDERLVRDYLTALKAGQFLDALNAFSMDASFRDATGTERHGIREIAAAFARQERPLGVEIEELRREGDALVARVRLSLPTQRASRTYRSVFRVRQRRISSLEFEPLPPTAPKARKSARPA